MSAPPDASPPSRAVGAIALDRAPGAVVCAAAEDEIARLLMQRSSACLPAPVAAWARGADLGAPAAPGAAPRGAAEPLPAGRLNRLLSTVRERGLAATVQRGVAALGRRRRAGARAVRSERAWRELGGLHERLGARTQVGAPDGGRGGPLVLTVGAEAHWAEDLPDDALWLDASFGSSDVASARRGIEWGLYHRDLGQVAVELTRVSGSGRPTDLVDRRAVSLRPDDTLERIRVRAALVAVDALVDAAAALFTAQPLETEALPSHATLGSGARPDPGLLDLTAEVERDLSRGLLARELYLRSRF